jgi:hypothetical protein
MRRAFYTRHVQGILLSVGHGFYIVPKSEKLFIKHGKIVLKRTQIFLKTIYLAKITSMRLKI